MLSYQAHNWQPALAATCLDHQPLDATHPSLLVGHFSTRTMVYAWEHAAHHVHAPLALPFSSEGRPPRPAAHLIQSPSIRSFPPRLSCVVGPRPDLPHPCALVLLGSARPSTLVTLLVV